MSFLFVLFFPCSGLDNIFTAIETVTSALFLLYQSILSLILFIAQRTSLASLIAFTSEQYRYTYRPS